ncbi:uncharacterized protein LOC131842076 [Achroia grisella]|uniref:uncharacterized protein LOC131842076 n=1 Tax=Achroia grisella TaxID=688607 RepID=UPI0027D1ECF3|nr:uncharacterized protein LOC131842076 [Achroia grisella]
MIKRYISIILKLFSLGMVIGAGGLWAGAGVETRSKYRDEQTLVGGAIWSQTIIPIGLMISKIVNEKLDKFVQTYFLISGVILLASTGIFLVVGEYKIMNRRVQRERDISITRLRVPETYDKIYLSIGILCLLAGLVTLVDLLVLMFY